jgi:hypothetical protein
MNKQKGPELIKLRLFLFSQRAFLLALHPLGDGPGMGDGRNFITR